MAISNNKISHLVSSEVPFFVRNDHEAFVDFIEAYYEYLEQEDKTVNRIKELETYYDIDRTIDDFAEKLYNQFLKFIPEETLVDKKMLLKHIKDFYRAKGTEKSTRFLMRILFQEEIDFYYPKKDVLRASDGKWFIQKSLRITDTTVDDVSDTSLTTLEKFISTKITGQTSNASAIVERIDRFYEGSSTLIDELILSNINGDFQNNEQVCALYDGPEATEELCANTFGGIINNITIIDAGSNYVVGDPVVILSNTGAGACAVVATVSSGNISAISILSGGSGYQNGDFLLISGGGGSGANANVSLVNTDGTVHPNTYNINYSTISLEANTPLNNTFYANLNFSDVSSNLYNAMSFFEYSNTGPAVIISVINNGSDYESQPSISVIANNRILSLGILGRMEIVNGGQNYNIGDIIEFTNIYGSYGAGANAIVWNVDTSATNAISEVRFTEMEGHIIGGSGYNNNFLPLANVRSSTGNDANVIVVSTLGTGTEFLSSNTTLGAIRRVTILNKGSSYEDASIDMTGYGDGAANLSVSVLEGAFTYPGRYLNDDGFLSSYNFIQDRDYYQSFSYVIKTKQSINKYRQMMKELNHPAGTKLFGEYMTINDDYTNSDGEKNATNDTSLIFYYKAYEKIANTINIAWTSHGISDNTIIYLEYDSGGFNNVQNGIYTTTNTTTNHLEIIQTYYSSNNTNGNVYVGISTA